MLMSTLELCNEYTCPFFPSRHQKTKKQNYSARVSMGVGVGLESRISSLNVLLRTDHRIPYSTLL